MTSRQAQAGQADQAAPGTPALAGVIDRFGFSGDGALERLRAQLGALGGIAGTAPRRAALFWALAFGVPLLLALLAGTAFGPASSDPFLRDWGAWTRFCIAVPLLVMIDRMVDSKLRLHLRQFIDAPLIPPGSAPAAADAVADAIRRGRSMVALAACLALAFGFSLTGAAGLSERGASSWLVGGLPDDPALTAAGWWAVLVSSPIFWFLLLRWLWRHLVWALLLRRLARLELRLVVSHPDGVGGLGFLGQYPNVFAALVLAMSATLAAAIARAFEQEALSLQTYSMVMGIWLAIVTGLFAVPLAAFAAPLRALKEETLLTTSARATRHFRAAERQALGCNIAAPSAAGTEGEADDPSKLYAAAKKLGAAPFSRAAILPIGAAALLPLIAAGATQIPFADLWKVAKRLLLL